MFRFRNSQGKGIKDVFPHLSTVILHMCNGIEKFAQKKYYKFEPDMPSAVYNNVRFVSAGICTVMMAKFEIPSYSKEVNTPNEFYRWPFSETRAIMGAIEAIATGGNLHYWKEYEEMYRDGAKAYPEPKQDLRKLTWAGWKTHLPAYRAYAEQLKAVGL